MSYQCHNREPFKTEMLVQSGYFDYSWTTGERVARWVTSPFRMERECQYSKDDKYADPQCVGCKHKSQQGELI